MSNILVVGGTGFFGRSILDSFINGTLNDFSINQIILTGREIPRDILFDKKKIIFYKYDSAIDKNLPDADYIIYAASSTSSSTYTKENYLNEINIQKKSIDNLNNYIFGKKFKKILYTSSGSVYGQKNLINRNTDEFVKCYPDDNNFEKSIYSNIKLEWENYFKDNLIDKSVIARCFAFIGKHTPLSKHFVIGNFLKNYINRENIYIKSTSRVYRSFMHADDLSYWLVFLLINSVNLKNNIFNVGSAEEIEIHDLANIFNLMLKRSKQNYCLDNKIDRYVPNISRAQKEFNLQLKYNLNQSILKVAYELRKHS